VSIENCVSFLDPLIESWDIDLATFGMEIVLNQRVAPGHAKKFEFVEKEPEPALEEEPGLKEFLHDGTLSGDATEEEIEFLTRLRFKGKRPAPLYYYRELQNLRDPLHFRTSRQPKELHCLKECMDPSGEYTLRLTAAAGRSRGRRRGGRRYTAVRRIASSN
jgi:hypothetical protein